MSTRRVVVVGYGRVGQAAVEAVLEAPDMVLAGVIRRDPTQRGELPPHIPVVAEVAQLGKVDGALLCVPTRQVPEVAERYLRAGIHTVDSYDIHGELVHLRERLGRIATEHGAVAIISAGWDPGTNSMVRALMELMAPPGDHLHQLRPRDEHGALGGGPAGARCAGWAGHHHPRRPGNPPPHGLCGVGARRRPGGRAAGHRGGPLLPE